MKKIITITLGVAIVIAIVFGIKSCNPRLKPLTTAEEQTAFIDANVDFTCLLKSSPDLRNDSQKAKTELNKIYEKYKFPTTDDQAMMDILNKYANDTEIISKIKTKVKNC